MNTHRWRIFAMAGLLLLSASNLQAEQISAVGLDSSPAVEASAAPAVHDGMNAFDTSDEFGLAPIDRIANEMPSATGAPAPVQVNMTPVGLMVSSSAVTVVPEPSTVVLLGFGAAGILWAARRRRK